MRSELQGLMVIDDTPLRRYNKHLRLATLLLSKFRGLSNDLYQVLSRHYTKVKMGAYRELIAAMLLASIGDRELLYRRLERSSY